jgi:hypothetical protein
MTALDVVATLELMEVVGETLSGVNLAGMLEAAHSMGLSEMVAQAQQALASIDLSQAGEALQQGKNLLDGNPGWGEIIRKVMDTLQKLDPVLKSIGLEVGIIYHCRIISCEC